jgi:RNA polymerase sigma-70 factor, ECF subfamily
MNALPAADPLTDALRRLQESPGDDVAWRSLYSRLWPFVIAVTYRRLKDKSVAEDVAQEVFIRLVRLQPFDKIGDSRQLRAYVWRMALNAASSHSLSERRRIRGLGALLESFRSSDQVAESIVSDDRLLLEEALGLARAAIEPDDKKLFNLLLAGCSLGEAAGQLGLAYSTAGVRLHRLRQTLRKHLS